MIADLRKELSKTKLKLSDLEEELLKKSNKIS